MSLTILRLLQYIRSFLRFPKVRNFLWMNPNFNLNLTLITTQPMNYSAGMHPEPFLGQILRCAPCFALVFHLQTRKKGRAERPVFRRSSESGTWLDLCLKSKLDSPLCFANFPPPSCLIINPSFLLISLHHGPFLLADSAPAAAVMKGRKVTTITCKQGGAMNVK